MEAPELERTVGGRRSRSLGVGVERLESRQLLSTVRTTVPAVSAPQAEVQRLSQAPAHPRVAEPETFQFRIDTHAIGDRDPAPAKNVKTTYFFALQQIPAGAVSTIKTAQAAFSKKYGSQVQINAPSGLHISVVRLGSIFDSTAAKAFARAQKFVGSFVQKYGDIEFHFRNVAGSTLRIKGQFVAYNVYLAQGSDNFGKFADKLADVLNLPPDAAESSPHVSILHYNPAIQKSISSFVNNTKLPKLQLDYTPTRLVLMETVGNHQYQAATINGKPVVINIQPR